MKLSSFMKLMRIHQWYKNIVIFLPLLFLGKFFELTLWKELFLGFLSLSLVSSSGYILNDILDRKKDQSHPEKKHRPIASGIIKVKAGITFAILILVLGMLLAYQLPIFFFLSVIALFALTQLYSLFFKHVVFVDILLIAINFVIRAVSGTFILNVTISPWLILCTFFLSLFLSVGKRKADLYFLQEDATIHRRTLPSYTEAITNALLLITTASLILSYSLYSILSNFHWLLLSLPFALYTIFRYLSFVYSNSVIARHPEKVFLDWKMDIAITFWILVVLFVTSF
ncbi:UbiA family prenyltransferase [Candidatus Woesearchaeota archaeon]|nr:UbiA family prenyltransferase [Candidatus Woesearchaeota archaeon]